MARKRKLSVEEALLAVIDSSDEDLKDTNYENSDDFEPESDGDVGSDSRSDTVMQNDSSSESDENTPGPSGAASNLWSDTCANKW